MRGTHKPGYRAPRTGEKRKTRQPLLIDKLSQAVRDAILKARSEGATWEETAERATAAAGAPISHSVCHRWYDVRVEQVQREVLDRAERARELAGVFAAKGFKDLPEAALNALSSEVFAVMEASTGPEREKSLGKLVFVLSRLIAAQARQKSVELEGEKIEIARQRLAQMGGKVKGLKQAIEKKKLSPAQLQEKIDELYGIAKQQNV